MKRALLLTFCVMSLAACSGGSGGDKKSGGGTGGGNLPAPSSYSGPRTLFTNKWKASFGQGVSLVSFTSTSTTLTTYCDNGLVASVTVKANNTATKIQNLESGNKDVNDAEKSCGAWLDAVTASYAINDKGQLEVEGGTVFEPY